MPEKGKQLLYIKFNTYNNGTLQVPATWIKYYKHHLVLYVYVLVYEMNAHITHILQIVQGGKLLRYAE